MDKLFKSKTSYDILNFITQNSDKKYFQSELSKILAKDPANLKRELSKLVKEGFIGIEINNGKKYYFLNKEVEYHKELIDLFFKLRCSEIDKRFNAEWLLGEEIPSICPFFTQIWLNCFVDEFIKPSGKSYEKIVSIHKGYHQWFYFDKKDACKVGDHLVKKIDKDIRFMEEVNKKIIYFSDKLRDFSNKIPELKLDQLSNLDLWNIYKKHEDIHTEYYQWGWIPVGADMFCNNLTNYGKKILKKHGAKSDQINEVLMVLTQPTKPSLLKIESDEFMKIGIKAQKDKKTYKLFKDLYLKFKEEDAKRFNLYQHSAEYEKKFDRKIKEMQNSINTKILDNVQSHYFKYYYTNFIFTEEQGVYSFEHYLKSLIRLVNSNNNLDVVFKIEQEEFDNIIIERSKLIKKYNFDKNLIKFFDCWGDFMVTKIYRRYAQIYALYKMTGIIEEIGKRLGLTLKQARFMTSRETKNALINGIFDVDEIIKRVNLSVYYADKNGSQFYSGVEAEKIIKSIKLEENLHKNEIIGNCGCRGVAKGYVKIVNLVSDMLKINNGDILVSIATQPNLLPAMKKSAAFVTDQGGVTSHAAIVAREMNTPCVIGTKNATKVLKDGDLVEVDANKGIVKIIKKSK